MEENGTEEESDLDKSPSKQPRKQSWPSKVLSPTNANQLSQFKQKEIPSFSFVQRRDMKLLLNSINNILKQSAGRKWVYHEWFYSNIDRALLLGENDFEKCLQQLYPGLKTRMLTKAQWNIVRRLMGKPRRCSRAFFAEERQSLESKRRKIRYLHQLKGTEISDLTQFNDMPDEVCVPMVIGTKVTAKVLPEGDGLRLFTGTVDAVDTQNNTYRIIFDREGIGAHSIPDIEVASEQYESINWQLFIVKERPKIAGSNSPPGVVNPVTKIREELLHSSASPARIRLEEALNNDIAGTYGGFPIKFLLLITRLSKILNAKKQLVDKLTEMNTEAEKKKSFKITVTRDFQKKYALVILELEKLNKKLKSTMNSVHANIGQLLPGFDPFDQVHILKQHCDDDAKDLIERSQGILKDQKIETLITKLTSLMLQVKQFAENDLSGYELSLLDTTVKDIKATLHPNNVSTFVDQVETNIAFIKNGLEKNNNFDAFSGLNPTYVVGHPNQCI